MLTRHHLDQERRATVSGNQKTSMIPTGEGGGSLIEPKARFLFPSAVAIQAALGQERLDVRDKSYGQRGGALGDQGHAYRPKAQRGTAARRRSSG